MKNNKKITLSLLSLTILLFSCGQNQDIDTDGVNIINTASNQTVTKNQLDTAAGEKPAENEEAYTTKIEKDFLQTLKNQTKEPPTKRAVHAKHHGVVKAYFKVDNRLLDIKDRVGIFAQNREYKTWIRFSNGNGNYKSDNENDVRGMALKLMGVSGRKLLENESNEQTQDFLLINTKSFFIKSLEDYVDFVKAGKDGGLGFAKFALLHPKTTYNIYKIISQPMANPLETAFYSTTSYKLGNSVVKYGAIPCAGENKTKPANPSENYLREAMVKTLNNKDVCYDFMVQIRKGSLENMPVEDATKEWKESESPYIKVATINIPKQNFDSTKQMYFAENMSYTPWHSLPEHKPLGFTNRVRKSVYSMISNYRHAQNGTISKEPVDFNIN